MRAEKGIRKEISDKIIKDNYVVLGKVIKC
jgi:hypothetical protein